MKVLVNGIGNIGTTVLNLLSDYQKLFEIEEIYALKNTSISSWNQADLDILESKGVIICTRNSSRYLPLENIINEIDYIFDCNANGFGLKNKEWYQSLANLKGCSAQGSEKAFGISFMSGINNDKLINQKFAHIVSCNTHSIASLIHTFTGHNPSQLNKGDFVVVRRSEDLGNHQRLVTANVVSRHLDNTVGTHHAIDVKDLYDTIGQELDIQSSDITTPSQLMHTVRFNFHLKEMPSQEQIENWISDNKYISKTNKFDSNIVFELGRKYSLYGRLFSHTIINSNNLLFDYENACLKGWAFIPQEGNTILSTIHAFLLQTNHSKESEIMDVLKAKMIRAEW